MKILKAKNHPSNAILILGRAEKALWQVRIADGRDIAAAKSAVRARCRELHAKGYRTVEVHAPTCAGGCILDISERDDD